MKYFQLILVLIIIYIQTFMFMILPAYSYTGYSRVVDSLETIAVKATPVRNLVKTAVLAGGGVATASKVIRVVAAGSGWIALGVIVGLAVVEYYYSAEDLNDVYDNSNGEESYNGGGSLSSYPVDYRNGTLSTGTVSTEHVSSMDGYNASDYGFEYWGLRTEGCCPKSGISTTYQMRDYMGWPGLVGMVFDKGYTTMNAGSCDANNWRVRLYYGYSTGTAVYSPVYTPGGVSEASIDDWFDANPSSPLHPDNKAEPVGVGVSVTPADSVTTVSITSSEITSEVVPVGDVGAGDTVVANNVPVPEGTESEAGGDLTTTRTTTVIDADTDEITEEVSAVCTAGASDTRSVGGVLQSHMDTWQGTGLIGAISGFYNVSFPDDLPVISVEDTFGQHEIDMNDYSGVFIILKAVTIGATALMCYRLVLG